MSAHSERGAREEPLAGRGRQARPETREAPRPRRPADLLSTRPPGTRLRKRPARPSGARLLPAARAGRCTHRPRVRVGPAAAVAAAQAAAVRSAENVRPTGRWRARRAGPLRSPPRARRPRPRPRRRAGPNSARRERAEHQRGRAPGVRPRRRGPGGLRPGGAHSPAGPCPREELRWGRGGRLQESTEQKRAWGESLEVRSDADRSLSGRRWEDGLEGRPGVSVRVQFGGHRLGVVGGGDGERAEAAHPLRWGAESGSRRGRGVPGGPCRWERLCVDGGSTHPQLPAEARAGRAEGQGDSSGLPPAPPLRTPVG